MSWLRRARCACLALSLTMGASPLRAQSTPNHPRRPSLKESFSASEIGLTIGAIFGTGILDLGEETWIGPATSTCTLTSGAKRVFPSERVGSVIKLRL